jgi:hypothetical protein
MTRSQPAQLDDLMAIVGAAIGQTRTAARDAWSFRLPEPAADDLDADLCFAFRDRPELGLRVRFEDTNAIVERGAGEPADTVTGSVQAFVDFFENRRSSQELFLERDWQIADGAGCGAVDVDEIRDYIRELEKLLPAPYQIADDMRGRVRASAARIGHTFEIESRSALAPQDFVERFVRTGTPVVLRGALRGLGWWSFTQLRQTFGDAYTHFSRYPNCTFAVGECFDKIQSGDAQAFKAALPVTAAIRRHYSVAEYFPEDAVFAKAQSLLVAPADHKMPASYRATVWHRDWADNLLAETIGQKRVRIASPLDEDRFGLSTTPACHYNVAVDHSALDPKAPAAHDGVNVRETTLAPGDVLFLPCGWLHTVENLTATAAINCWRVRPPEMLNA